VLSGVNKKIQLKMQRALFDKKIGVENITPNIDKALARAKEILFTGLVIKQE
jgi:SulP family sulfate permease